MDAWNFVIFSDERDLFPKKYGKEYVRAKKKQDLPKVILPKPYAQNDLTIKAWVAISSYGVGPLVKYTGI